LVVNLEEAVAFQRSIVTLTGNAHAVARTTEPYAPEFARKLRSIIRRERERERKRERERERER
jgi:hypothetical protein